MLWLAAVAAAALLGYATGRLGYKPSSRVVEAMLIPLILLCGALVGAAAREAPIQLLGYSILYATAPAAASAAAAYLAAADGGGVQRGQRGDAGGGVVLASLLAGATLGLLDPGVVQLVADAVDPLIVALVFTCMAYASDHLTSLRVSDLAVPLASVSASVAVGLLLYPATHITPAVAAAMGWYSLAGPVVEAVTRSSLQAGVAVLANMLREQLTLALAPTARLPAEAVIGMGGATTMDTTLPVITVAYGGIAARRAVVNGVVVSAVVPLLLPLLAQLH